MKAKPVSVMLMIVVLLLSATTVFAKDEPIKTPWHNHEGSHCKEQNFPVGTNPGTPWEIGPCHAEPTAIPEVVPTATPKPVIVPTLVPPTNTPEPTSTPEPTPTKPPPPTNTPTPPADPLIPPPFPTPIPPITPTPEIPTPVTPPNPPSTPDPTPEPDDDPVKPPTTKTPDTNIVFFLPATGGMLPFTPCVFLGTGLLFLSLGLVLKLKKN